MYDHGSLRPRALVTGGAGFIGSHLVELLLAEGYRVRVLDNLVRGARSNLRHADGAELIVGDIRDMNTVERSMVGVSVVFHLAALTSVSESCARPMEYLDVCGHGTARVVHAASRAGVRRIVYAGSSSAYGDPLRLPVAERDDWRPASPYAVAKLLGERVCSLAQRDRDIETVRLRFFNVYGPRQDGKSAYAGALAAFITALREGRTPTIYGDGTQTRDFIHVSDVARALLLAATSPSASGALCNVGTGRGISIADLARLVTTAAGADPHLAFAPPRPGEVRHSVADVSRAKQLLGFEAHVDLEAGIAALWRDGAVSQAA